MNNSNIGKETDFRVLVTSIGSKIPLLVAIHRALQRFSTSRELLGGDCNSDCLGRYFVDRFVLLPPDAELNIDQFLDSCRKWRISAIIPTRDGELAFFARYKERFAQAGIGLMVSDLSAVKICLDKLTFSKHLQQLGFVQVIPTSTSIQAMSANSLAVKERYGSGARKQLLNVSLNEAAAFAATLKEPIFQPYIEGQEFSIDLYMDRRVQPLGAIARSRDLIINGEAQISTTADKPTLEDLCCKLAIQLKLTGHLIFQIIVDKQQRVHIIECNCRFGGASTLGLASGLQSPLWFFSEITGRDPMHYPFIRHLGQLRQVRHPADMLIKISGDPDE